jgi:tetratricopeptide (TPR) repeat protein
MGQVICIYPYVSPLDFQKALELWLENPMPYEGGCIYMGIYASYRALSMLEEALSVAMEGLKRLPEEAPGLYQNLGDAYFAMGWRNEAISILKKGVEKFYEDEELKQVLKDIEDDTDDPNNGNKPHLLGLIFLMVLLRKRLGIRH